MKHTKTKEGITCSIKKYLSELSVRFQKHWNAAQETDRRIKETKEAHARQYPEIYLKGWY